MNTIINSIPNFIENCRLKGYSNNTQKNYQRYLKRFCNWLEENKKGNLEPDQLNRKDIEDYKQYLVGIDIKDITQNYYLIALRALLRHYSEKDIASLPPDRIRLPRLNRNTSKNSLGLVGIKKLIEAINVKTNTGLRDRAIIEILLNSNLKTKQLINLPRNLDQIRIHLPKDSLQWINKYILTRNDDKSSLFCLSGRTIERIITKYGKLINLPFTLTPEILRWSHLSAILENDKKPECIENIFKHKTFALKNYEYNFQRNFFNKPSNLENQWNIVENSISKELDWLKSNISILPNRFSKKPTPLLECDDCIYRKIAVFIVTGKIAVNKFKRENNAPFWNVIQSEKREFYHGKDWHQKMMSIVHGYFEKNNYKVSIESTTNYGRADLGIILDDHPLYIEIGTISLFKLWYNLATMENATFLLIPNNNYILEFIL